jgi:hypothetical protein
MYGMRNLKCMKLVYFQYEKVLQKFHTFAAPRTFNSNSFDSDILEISDIFLVSKYRN